jgi:NAD(P)-dependent dehydrogenase (short-subunit alcohol dehydrogenase family)
MSLSYRLDGKVTLVTGASRGLARPQRYRFAGMGGRGARGIGRMKSVFHYTRVGMLLH